MTQSTRLIAGTMSGTSADGIDVALVEIAGRATEMSATLRHHHAVPYTPAMRRRIVAVRERVDDLVPLTELVALGRDIALAYADAVTATLAAAGVSADALACIAAHGQTLFHAPPLTLQWIDPAVLAAAVGCAVVSDFRRADCAAGGQGAPLVPFADFVLYRHPSRSRVLLNLGGIANLTYLPAGAAPGDVIAFDTGPANCISDWLCRRHDPAGSGFDAGGARALRGAADAAVVAAVMRDSYFARPPPKSTDVPAMIAAFQTAGAAAGLDVAVRLDEALATACQLVVTSVVAGFDHFVGRAAEEWIVSGGGARNAAMMNLLRACVRVVTADPLGIPAEAKEAVAFALLGSATLDGEPANLPRVTGASRPVVLGTITPKP